MTIETKFNPGDRVYWRNNYWTISEIDIKFHRCQNTPTIKYIFHTMTGAVSAFESEVYKSEAEYLAKMIYEKSKRLKELEGC